MWSEVFGEQGSAAELCRNEVVNIESQGRNQLRDVKKETIIEF